MASRWRLPLLAGVVALLVPVLARADAPSLTVGHPFRFAVSFGAVAASALGSDGTAWVVMVAGSDPAHRDGFTVSARAADTRTMPPVFVSTSGDTLVDTPVLAVSDATATVVWLTVDAGTVTVDARRCTLRGCAGAQVLATWHASKSITELWGSGSAFAVPEPVVASAGGRAVVVFARFGTPDPLMMWAQSDGSRFGAPHSFAVSGNYDPVIASEPDGNVVAAWLAGGGPVEDAFGVYYAAETIDWSQWSPTHGFLRPHATPAGPIPAGSACTYAELAAAATSTGVTLAWLQGSSSTHSAGYGIDGPPFLPVWATSEHDGAFSKPQSVLPAGASSISLAGGGDVAAVALGTRPPSGPAVTSPALIATSIAGRRFSAPVALDPTAGPPAVSVDGAGDVLATWLSDPTDTPARGSAELAIAAPGGPFAAPVKIDIGAGPGGGLNLPAPLIDTAGRRSFIASTTVPVNGSGDATTFGVFATP